MIDLACVFYVKRYCACSGRPATVLMLRRYGWHAEMVIGVQVVSVQIAWPGLKSTKR